MGMRWFRWVNLFLGLACLSSGASGFLFDSAKGIYFVNAIIGVVNLVIYKFGYKW